MFDNPKIDTDKINRIIQYYLSKGWYLGRNMQIDPKFNTFLIDTSQLHLWKSSIKDYQKFPYFDGIEVLYSETERQQTIWIRFNVEKVKE